MRSLWTGCLVLTVLLPIAGAQTAQRTSATRAKPVGGAALSVPRTWVQFTQEKPVLGLPLRSVRSMVRCSSDNTAYFNLGGDLQLADVGGTPRLYSIATDGEVKSPQRKLPLEFNDIEVLDFFVGDRTIVTLLRVANKDGHGVRESGYFLSMLDPEGDFRDLAKMEGHFRPLKIALFGDGEMLVLGWDDANLLPLLAVLKEDGTIRRFLDVDDLKLNGMFVGASALFELMHRAAFVPFGSNVLLTFPGTANRVLVLSPAGLEKTIPVEIPAGYVLHDVLNSTGGGSLIVRVEEVKQPEMSVRSNRVQDPQRRLLEMNAYTGRLIRELVFEKPEVSDVTCGGNNSLTAIFADALPDARMKNAPSPAPERAKQLVVGSMER